MTIFTKRIRPEAILPLVAVLVGSVVYKDQFVIGLYDFQ